MDINNLDNSDNKLTSTMMAGQQKYWAKSENDASVKLIAVTFMASRARDRVENNPGNGSYSHLAV